MVSPRRDSWFRKWACADHLDGLTGLRQFGAPYEPHPVTAGRSAYPSSPASGTCEHANGGDGPRRNKRPPASLRRTQFRTDASKVWRCRFRFLAPRRSLSRRFGVPSPQRPRRAVVPPNDTASTVFPQDSQRRRSSLHRHYLRTCNDCGFHWNLTRCAEENDVASEELTRLGTRYAG
jgi:hypothetical protein